ncbi:MAG: cyclic nucleotide-binding domain-containing protein [Pseudomonadota bacterium]
MTSFDWDGLLRDHPVFQPLDEGARAKLLDGGISVEREFAAGDIVLRQGAIGSSVFVVGKGRAAVMLERKDREPVTLYTVTQGELLGEMALFEDRPRAATVEATEAMTVLEIRGEPFLEMLKERSEVSLTLLARLSRRLRYTDQKVLECRFSGLDESVTVMNARIDAALEAADSKLAASKTMFEQTNTRSNEIISSGQRANTALKLFVGLFAAVGGLGLWNLYDQREAVTNIRAEVQENLTKVTAELEALERKVAAADRLLEETQHASNRVHGILDRAEVAKLVDKVKTQQFTADAMDQMADVVKHFDREAVEELSKALNAVVYRGKIFHDELGQVLADDRVTDPNGVIFVTYYQALSAINSADSAFAELLRDLETRIDGSDGRIDRPRYVDNNTRSILKAMAKAVPEAPVTLEERHRKIDALLDVMSDLRRNI